MYSSSREHNHRNDYKTYGPVSSSSQAIATAATTAAPHLRNDDRRNGRITSHGFRADELLPGNKPTRVGVEERILFAGWASTVVQLSNGSLELRGLPSPAEVYLLHETMSRIATDSISVDNNASIEKLFGYETWVGYHQATNGAVLALKDLDSDTKDNSVVTLLEKAKDVACAGMAGHHTIVAIDAVNGQLYSWSYAHLHAELPEGHVTNGRANKAKNKRMTLVSTVPQPVQLLDDNLLKDTVVNTSDDDDQRQVRFSRVWAGETHFLALSEGDGRLFSWGSGRFGQLGHGTIQAINTWLDHPMPIEGLEGLRIVDAACGATHSLALSDIGDVYAFGLNNYGQLGIINFSTMPQYPVSSSSDCKNSILNDQDKENGEESSHHTINTALPHLVDFYDMTRATTPQPVDVHVVKIASGNAHSAVLDDEGHLWTSGWNKYGQLGRDHRDNYIGNGNARRDPVSSFFQRVPSDRKWDHVYCGRWTTYAW